MFSRLKQSRGASFLIVGLVYIIAAVIGILCYRALPYSLWVNLLLADVIATVITFLFSLLFQNASVYDPYWSVQPIVILIAFAIGSEMTALRLLLLIAVCLWGVRLTANWAYTFHGLLHQDWRYTMLHEKTGAFYPIINFVGIHLVPTLIVYGCTLPAVYAFTEEGKCGVLSILGFLICIGAVVLQGSADIQMHRFRKQKTGGFLQTGLWKYSRHPNYLAEILMWWGIGLCVVCALPQRWYLLAGALMNTVLFLAVSIPMADKRQSRKAGFAEYKKATRMLLPIKK